MVKPSFTDARDYSTTAATARADALLDDLAGGKTVSGEQMEAARDTLLDMLWLDRPATRGTAEHGLLTIYAKSSDPGDRAQMVGELYAAGPRGESLLDRLLDRPLDEEPSTNLTRDDLTAMRDTAKLPIRERLAYIADRLAAESGRGEQPERTPPEPESPHDAVLPRRQAQTEARGRTHSSDGTPPDGEALAELQDPNVPNEKRHQRAMELGRRAVPVLGEMLVRDDGQREFALATLVRLGDAAHAARAVHHEMQRIEMLDSGGGRRSAELVRHAIENGEEQFDARARERIRGAAVADSWLKSTLDLCDKPNILRAAGGRESLAIALAVRKLHELRAARH